LMPSGAKFVICLLLVLMTLFLTVNLDHRQNQWKKDSRCNCYFILNRPNITAKQFIVKLVYSCTWNMYIYIYIERERERERECKCSHRYIHLLIFTHSCIHIQMLICRVNRVSKPIYFLSSPTDGKLN
jgi:hypothetical protein